MLHQHLTFGPLEAAIAHQDNMQDAERELDAAEAFFREGNGKDALYHWVRANGSLGIATGVASAGGLTSDRFERARLALAQRIMTFHDKIVMVGHIKRCFCDCVISGVRS